MIIYIDKDYKCHVEDDGTRRAVEAPYFDGKCSALIEGYRYVPPGEAWVGPDGKVTMGEMLTPWQSGALLMEFQRQYEDSQEQQADLKAALEVLGVTE